MRALPTTIAKLLRAALEQPRPTPALHRAVDELLDVTEHPLRLHPTTRRTGRRGTDTPPQAA